MLTVDLHDLPPIRVMERRSSDDDFYSVVAFGIRVAISLAVMYYAVPQLINHTLDSVTGENKDSSNGGNLLAQKLKRDDLKKLSLSKHELIIANDVMAKDTSSVTFEDVGGLDKEIQTIKESLIVPMRLWKLFEGRKVLSYPTGILLYGKPGTGKTLCVQALANETDAALICIKSSTLLDKYLGESQKLVSALFSLARMLAPCIIFIDEIDTLLKPRSNSGESFHVAVDGMQGAFLAEWDGLQKMSKADGENHKMDPPVIVVGATNRPLSLDKAILRRMPISIKMPMPDNVARMDIIMKHLKGESISEDLDLERVVNLTEGYSGSDLKEFVRVAKLQREKEFVNWMLKAEDSSDAEVYYDSMTNRPLSNEDFEVALQNSAPSAEAATEYQSDIYTDEYNEKVHIAERFKEKIRKREESQGPELD